MSMSVHDALEAWQSGEITAARAIALTGAEDLLDLYAFRGVRRADPHGTHVGGACGG